MEDDRHIWRCWARNLQQWGVSEWAAALLEAAGPLTIVGAQAVYFSQPWLNWMISEDRLFSLARLLEDSANRALFVNYLREAMPQ